MTRVAKIYLCYRKDRTVLRSNLLLLSTPNFSYYLYPIQPSFLLLYAPHPTTLTSAYNRHPFLLSLSFPTIPASFYYPYTTPPTSPHHQLPPTTPLPYVYEKPINPWSGVTEVHFSCTLIPSPVSFLQAPYISFTHCKPIYFTHSSPYILIPISISFSHSRPSILHSFHARCPSHYTDMPHKTHHGLPDLSSKMLVSQLGCRIRWG